MESAMLEMAIEILAYEALPGASFCVRPRGRYSAKLQNRDRAFAGYYQADTRKV
jgi:hypothetical protein